MDLIMLPVLAFLQNRFWILILGIFFLLLTEPKLAQGLFRSNKIETGFFYR